MEDCLDENSKIVIKGISKKVIHGGPGTGNVDYINYPTETKFIFDYEIRLTDFNKTVIDDTRKYKKHMELYSGKKFQLEVWELCLETMAVGEVSSFTVSACHLLNFAVVNKKLRDYMLDKHLHHGNGHGPKHCCGMMTMKDQGGLGYEDLDKLMTSPQDLEFIFHLIKVERPDEGFRKETWIMNEEEKDLTVPLLRQKGNSEYRQGHFQAASEAYREALHILDQLSLREKPGESEWLAIEQRKLPLLVNLAQCEIGLEEFYAAVGHLTDALALDPHHVKALFRRGLANRRVWNLDAAEQDLNAALRLDGSLQDSVQKELGLIADQRLEKERDERSLFAGKLFQPSTGTKTG